MRLKTKWHKQQQRSLEDIANTIGFLLWRISHTTVDKMYQDGFNFETNEQLVNVIAEFSTFLLQCGGAKLYPQLSEEEFQRFVNGMAQKVALTYKENMEQARQGEASSRDITTPFLEQLNQRLADYAEFSYPDGKPSYPALRYFGTVIAAIMPASGSDNKWIIEQVMEVEAPQMLQKLDKSLNDLLPTTEDSVNSAPD
ncbi:hypothetical protein D5085_01950 [Ectothiorhodospiraceae bacterium BW-2]|nr:hypothetical protein D5085_01950 [Ectothiorhodospiraceae bacterium BW-2]